MNTKENTMSSMWKKALLGLALATLIPAWPAMAVLTVISEDFEDDANNASPPTNVGFPGTWQAGTGLIVSSPAVGARAGSNEKPFGNQNGYLKADSTPLLSTVGQPVHAEIRYRYEDGFTSFGITTDTSAGTPAGQSNSALLYLMYQDATGGATLGLNYRNSSGSLVLLPNTEGILSGSTFHLIQMDYLIGDSTARLVIDTTNVFSSVPLRNPGGVVDGLFFDDPELSTRSLYRIDNIVMTVPEPTTVTLTSLAIAGLIVARRRRA